MSAAIQKMEGCGEIAVLRLTVANHPGVMSHVIGLFSRRRFNVDVILCTPERDPNLSRIWISVRESGRLDHIVRQIEKLADVREVSRLAGAGAFLRGVERLRQELACGE